MLNNDIQVDFLGKLYIEKVYVYYEEPLMFSCKNRLGHIFLANCIDLDEETKTWLMLPITERRLQSVIRNTISVRDAFINPEDEFLWKVLQKEDEVMLKAHQIFPDELTDDDLPLEGAYIEIDEDDGENEIKDQERNNIANSTKRVVFDVSLEINEGHSTEISPEMLSKSIMEIQNTLYSIASKSESINSKFSKSVIEENQLNITETYAASFGIRFMSKNLCDLLGDTNVSQNIKILMQLVEAKGDTEKIRNTLNGLNPKVGLHYKKMLSILKKNNAGMKTYFTEPNKSVKSVFLSLKEVEESLNALESEIDNTSINFTYAGQLVGVDVERKTFSFIPSEEARIEGKLSEDVNVEKFVVPCRVNVVIEERLIINQITKKEQIEYTLLNIEE